jgi:hypothetical protein
MKELSLHILDIIENSVGGGATRIEVNIVTDENPGMLEIYIVDNGRGMDQKMLSQVTNPFFTTRTTRKIGMGLSLLKQQAEQTNGRFEVASEPGKGTRVYASFAINHFDRQPIGDLAGVIINCSVSYLNIDILLNIKTLEGAYHFSSDEVKEILADVPVNSPEVILLLKEMINTNIKDMNMIN